MRISISLFIFVAVFSNATSSFGLDEELNASFAPGADGQHVSQSTSANLPSQHESETSVPTVGVISKSSPIRLDRIVFRESGAGSDPIACINTVIDGIEYNTGFRAVAVFVLISTGQEISQRQFCFNPNGNEITNPTNPPTYAELWQEIYSQGFLDQAQSSGAYVAPKSPGLTGLPTNIWAQFPDGQTITRTASFPGGYTLNASAYISQVSIFVRNEKGSTNNIANLASNGTGLISGGSFENPMTVYRFKTKGNYQISTGIIWTGRNATLSGPGFGPISIPLGSIRLEINRDYDVQELKPAITK